MPEAMDVLSDVLAELRPKAVLLSRVEVGGGFRFRFAARDRRTAFGVALSGTFVMKVSGSAKSFLIEPGDFFLLTSGKPYRIGWGPPTSDLDATELSAPSRLRDGIVRVGEEPPTVTVAGGLCTFEAGTAELLFRELPPVVHVKGDRREAMLLRRTLELQQAEQATEGPCQSVILDRLTHTLLIQALRAHAVNGGSLDGSLLAALTDHRLSRVLFLLHRDPAMEWTVQSLAREAGMSRSAFASHFKAKTGLSPMDYLTRWRMHRVKRALQDTRSSFAEIASQYGYDSRSSCSKAFARVFGRNPGEVRREFARYPADRSTKDF